VDGKFWVVIKDDPTKRSPLSFNPKTYLSAIHARSEAERLCKKERCKFFVLEAVASVEQTPPPTPPVVWNDVTDVEDEGTKHDPKEEEVLEEYDDPEEDEDDEGPA
jgi:hypothetical protein